LGDILSGENKIIDPAFLGAIDVYYEHQRPLNINLPDKWEEI
jgi:hypothetical protein